MSSLDKWKFVIIVNNYTKESTKNAQTMQTNL